MKTHYIYWIAICVVILHAIKTGHSKACSYFGRPLVGSASDGHTATLINPQKRSPIG